MPYNVFDQRLLPQCTLLVTARGGTVCRSLFLFFFFFWCRETVIISDKRLTWSPSAPFCAMQRYSGSYCNVWNEVTASGECLPDDGEHFQSLLRAAFDLLLTPLPGHRDMPLPRLLSGSRASRRNRAACCLTACSQTFLHIPSTQTTPQSHYERRGCSRS